MLLPDRDVPRAPNPHCLSLLCRLLSDGRAALAALVGARACGKQGSKGARERGLADVCRAAFACEVAADEVWRQAVALMQGEKWRRRVWPIAHRAKAREGPGAGGPTTEALQKMVREGQALGIDPGIDWCLEALEDLEQRAREWSAEAKQLLREALPAVARVNALIEEGNRMPVVLGAPMQRLLERVTPYCICQTPFDGRGMVECDACKVMVAPARLLRVSLPH